MLTASATWIVGVCGYLKQGLGILELRKPRRRYHSQQQLSEFRLRPRTRIDCAGCNSERVENVMISRSIEAICIFVPPQSGSTTPSSGTKLHLTSLSSRNQRRFNPFGALVPRLRRLDRFGLSSVALAALLVVEIAHYSSSSRLASATESCAAINHLL